ncbi:MAG: hypothetical protein J6S26_03475 [Solobacterium sp.]|nr:hypothetical protein [Solobacterium sp.]
MKRFLELGDRYAARSNWTDFALTKFCLCAIGVMIGVNLPKQTKTKAMAAAGGVFALTYIPLMARVLRTALSMKEQQPDA